jgi:tellurium resistance protein TerD
MILCSICLEENEMGDEVTCPKCGSTQVSGGTKGFGLGKAIVGDVLLGPVGLLGGFLGSKKVMVSCLSCGFRWEASKR